MGEGVTYQTHAALLFFTNGSTNCSQDSYKNAHCSEDKGDDHRSVSNGWIIHNSFESTSEQTTDYEKTDCRCLDVTVKQSELRNPSSQGLQRKVARF
jgi:hypothetical protein